MVRRNSSADSSSKGAKTELKASLTQTSIGPTSRSTRSAAANTASASAMSTGYGYGAPPAARTSCAAPASPCSPRASSTTRSPRAANPTALARPTPAEAPVTTTVRPTPCSFPISLRSTHRWVLDLRRSSRSEVRFAVGQMVADVLLARLREWEVRQVFGYPGDGINGLLAAWGRADNDPQFVQARHEEMAAFEATGYAKFSGRVGVCAATSGPGAIHLLNGLYDAKLDHVPVVAIVGQTERSAMGGAYQQEVDLLSLFKDVCSDYVQMCTVPQQLPNLLDRAIRIALAERAPTCLIFPSDVLELPYEPPGHAFKQVPSSLGVAPPRPSRRTTPPCRPRPTSSTRAARSRCSSARARAAASTSSPRLRPAGRRGGEGAAGQGRAARRPALRHRLDRAARHDPVLPDDDGLRHAAHRRFELPVHPVPARVRPGAGDPDRPVRQVDRDALPVRAEPRRRRQGHPAGADPAAAAQGRPVVARVDRVGRRPLVGDQSSAGR